MNTLHQHTPRILGRILVALLPVLALGGALQARAADDAVLRATLPNGLQVVIVPDRLAPVVSTRLTYLVGSVNAPEGFPGTAHALEHMMFRGTRALSSDALLTIGARLGGRFNAQTSPDTTRYEFTAPAADLGIVLHIEADRMRGLLLAETDWAKERGAIEQEVSQNLSKPGYGLSAMLRLVLYMNTPYAHNALGTRPSFGKTDVGLLRRFYDNWYAPNNAILVIVGDVDQQAALAQVKAAFTPIAPRPLPPRPVVNPKPVLAVSLLADTDAAVGGVGLAWRMPGAGDADFAAADILGDVLASPRYALHGLVTSGRALSAGFEYGPDALGGLGVAHASYPKGADPKPVLDALRAVMADVQAHGVPDALVEAAKRREIANFAFGAESIEGQANLWSSVIALFGKRSPDDMRHTYEAVTPAQVNALAKRLLTPETAITGTQTPSARPHPAGAAEFGGSESFSRPPMAGVVLPDWASATLNRLTAPRPPAMPVSETLANGMRLLVVTEHVSHTIMLRGAIRMTPPLEEPAGKEGVAVLTARLFEFGSTTRDRLQLATALDDIAVTASAGPSFSLSATTDHFEQGLALLADNELHPAFPAAAFKVYQQQAVAARAGVLQSPGYRFQRSVLTALQPANDPQLRETTPHSLGGITLADIQAFYARAYRPDLTTIVVVGDITPERARAMINRAFGAWSVQGPKPVVDLGPVPDSHASRTVIADPVRLQDKVVIAQTIDLTLHDPARYAFDVGNSILGRSATSRLMTDLRGTHGYVYHADSVAGLGRTRSTFMIGFGADPDKVGPATALALADVNAMRSAPVSTEELLMAKMALLQAMPLESASFGGLASLYLGLATHNQPLDTPARAAEAIAHVSAADVQTVFHDKVRPSDFATLILGASVPGESVQ